MNVLKMIARAFDTKGYPDDKNPEHWRTMCGAKVHLAQNSKIDGGYCAKT